MNRVRPHTPPAIARLAALAGAGALAACGGGGSQRRAADQDRDPEHRLRHDGEPRPGLGRGVPQGRAATVGSRSRAAARASASRRSSTARSTSPTPAARSKPEESEQAQEEHRQGAEGVHRRLRRARDLRPQGQPARRDQLEQLAEIYARGRQGHAAGRELGVKIPGVERRRDRPRQPPEQLRHLRVLPRARGRQEERLQARLARHERLEGRGRAGGQDAGAIGYSGLGYATPA